MEDRWTVGEGFETGWHDGMRGLCNMGGVVIVKAVVPRVSPVADNNSRSSTRRSIRRTLPVHSINVGVLGGAVWKPLCKDDHVEAEVGAPLWIEPWVFVTRDLNAQGTAK